jgi:putative nucleotidyltransferase with HDIG domain
MQDRIENAFRGVISALQIAKLYSTEHLKFTKFLDKAYQDLREALAERAELVIGIIGEELAYEKEILFELSKSVKPVILYLKSRGIEKIAFYQAITKDELAKFISFLIAPKDEIKKEPQEYLSSLGVRNIAVGKIKTGISEGSLEKSAVEAVDYLNLYNNSLDNFSQSVGKVLDLEELDYTNLRFNVTHMLENLLGRYQEFLKLASVKRYDVNTFVHILNVSILSMYFATKLGFSQDDILDIGIAALFHDIGKMYLSRSLIKKTDKLTGEEYDKVKSHTLSGAEILLKYEESLGVLPVVVAFEHHLKAEFRGYPRLYFPKKPHLGSLIVSICDIYDALFQRRSYKVGYPPLVIYALMVKEKQNLFEPKLVDDFFKVVGVWPIGTIVGLSDSRIGVVRDTNEDDIFSPQVEVVFPEDKKEYLDLRTKKEQLSISRSLDPLLEGKEYMKMV